MPDLSIELTLRGRRSVHLGCQRQGSVPIRSPAMRDYLDGVLTLTQADAPALVGKVVNLGEKQFGFELLGGPQAATIQFSR